MYNVLHASIHRHVWEILWELMSQIVEQHVTVVLSVGIVRELCLCHQLAVTAHLKRDRLRNIVLCRGMKKLTHLENLLLRFVGNFSCHAI